LTKTGCSTLRSLNFTTVLGCCPRNSSRISMSFISNTKTTFAYCFSRNSTGFKFFGIGCSVCRSHVRILFTTRTSVGSLASTTKLSLSADGHFPTLISNCSNAAIDWGSSTTIPFKIKVGVPCTSTARPSLKSLRIAVSAMA
jgi:hypothetical protein